MCIYIYYVMLMIDILNCVPCEHRDDIDVGDYNLSMITYVQCTYKLFTIAYKYTFIQLYIYHTCIYIHITYIHTHIYIHIFHHIQYLYYWGYIEFVHDVASAICFSVTVVTVGLRSQALGTSLALALVRASFMNEI